MRTSLQRIEILSIYRLHGERVLLPERMAKCTPDTHTALINMVNDIKKAGGRLILSDLFRSYDMQFQAHLDWKSGKKKAFSPSPGGSMHEAGRAFDLSLKDLKITLREFWDISAKHGVVPIISSPDPKKSEAWHFECRGSHVTIYEYYRDGKANNMKAYRAMVVSSILSIGVNVDMFDTRQKEAYLQSCLVRLGKELGNIDGIIGRRTRGALEEIGIASGDTDDVILQVEDLLQEKFPDEFGVRAATEETLFDYEAPEYLES